MIHVVQPVSSKKILPTTFPLPGAPSQVIDIVASRGEYEPASFAVRPLARDIAGLLIEGTDLVGSSGTLSRDAIDIRIVKAWFQGGGGWESIEQTRLGNGFTLVPELLLKDDRLVKVDHDAKDNHIRLEFSHSARYVLANELASAKDRLIVPADVFPVRDASQLQPVDIPRNEARQFWITLHVPATAKPGDYTGKIFLKENGVIIGNLDLHVTVLPFDLAEPSLTYSIYYRGQLSDRPTISSELKSRTQFEAELRNMIAHGVNNPTVYQRLDRNQLNDVLAIREGVGMDLNSLFYLGTGTGNPTTAEGLRELRGRIQYLLNVPAVSRFRETYVYGIDEAKDEKLASQLKAWNVTRSLGAKVFVAGYRGTFEKVGSMLDLLVLPGRPNHDEMKKFHAAGSKVFSYANPQAGPENPHIFRKNYGINLWRNGYDGVMTYAYQDSMGFIWNDFDHSRWRDHVFAYPTVDGVIDTLAWEGFREGVDDVRYITTLEKSLAKLKSSSFEGKYWVILEADNFLNELRGYTGEDMDGMRRRIVSYIIQLDTLE
ncbi:MAG: hypothetical protein KC643_18105 [Nitrospira sp.]|nr:hypothetical protein [Nitrospira sp.]